jgi:hypothetical protein
MYGYYGRSGQFIRSYFDLLQGRVGPDTHIHLGLAPDDRIFSDQFITTADSLFSGAEKVADNDEILRRVDMAWLPILYLKCLRAPLLAKYDGSYRKFCDVCNREGITHYAEAGEQQRLSFHRFMEGQ